MKRDKFSWNLRDNFALQMWGLALLSSASVALSAPFRDVSMAIVGSIGLAVVATGLAVWGSGRTVRRIVAERRELGGSAWPVYAQSDRDPRPRRGFLVVDDAAMAVTVRGHAARLGWSEVASVTLQTSGLIRSGRVVVKVPARGTLILEILARDAMVSLNDSKLREVTETIDRFKHAS